MPDKMMVPPTKGDTGLCPAGEHVFYVKALDLLCRWMFKITNLGISKITFPVLGNNAR